MLRMSSHNDGVLRDSLNRNGVVSVALSHVRLDLDEDMLSIPDDQINSNDMAEKSKFATLIVVNPQLT